ncbi:cytochrome C [Campylobacter upsaliensis]|uniref:Cytochrome C n=2 Tax=Campylobacter TaxID=194 RepID=A0A5L4FSV9_CAMUP|nr:MULTISPECIES: cytochrome C [Campylobacter]EAH4719434.1 cytochrome C [Campylobacter upsaliensis]EAI3917193.1 cytochrome C [Campylobacter upsaliensis]EAI4456293.1 cytochrome C [Campylobacter upsaliensis]EAI6142937.1 cytochrome C [Campylobacter upsaliensis]EAJ2437866.1 cytochrome C [Campylobacter upsaliensis]
MRIFSVLILFLALFLAACSAEKEQEVKKSVEDEVVQIEQNDEKTELNDNNLPLPVEDEAR